MFKKFTKLIALFVLLNFSASQCLSLQDIFKKNSSQSSKVKRLLSNKLVKSAIMAIVANAIVYLINLLRFKLVEDDFDDSPDIDLLREVAGKMGVNPDNIKLKLTTLKKNRKNRGLFRGMLDSILRLESLRKTLSNTIACTGPMGNVYLTADGLGGKLTRDEKMFILGHEISHKKYHDCLCRFMVSTAINFVLQEYFVALKAKVLLSFAARAIFDQTIGKMFEVRADLKSASLGKEFASGGVRVFERLFDKEKSWSERIGDPVAAIKEMLNDPHPSASNRIRYLKFYKKWKYKENSEPATV